jgi:hypothetical protein
MASRLEQRGFRAAGVPWAPDILLYEDSYSIQVQGQFNLRFRFDGVYSLSRIDIRPEFQCNHTPCMPSGWALPRTDDERDPVQLTLRQLSQATARSAAGLADPARRPVVLQSRLSGRAAP